MNKEQLYKLFCEDMHGFLRYRAEVKVPILGLKEMDLSGKTFSGLSIGQITLDKINFSHCNFKNCQFDIVTLTRCRFDGASFEG
jgi:uncharacterized protein YjbI with pentapeptide repeats